MIWCVPELGWAQGPAAVSVGSLHVPGMEPVLEQLQLLSQPGQGRGQAPTLPRDHIQHGMGT